MINAETNKTPQYMELIFTTFRLLVDYIHINILPIFSIYNNNTNSCRHFLSTLSKQIDGFCSDDICEFLHLTTDPLQIIFVLDRYLADNSCCWGPCLCNFLNRTRIFRPQTSVRTLTFPAPSNCLYNASALY